MGRPKGLGRAPVSLTALPLEQKRGGLLALGRFKSAPKDGSPAPKARASTQAPTAAASRAAAPGSPHAAKAEPITAPAMFSSELEASMAQLWDSLGAVPAERGRVLQFAAASSGEGASTMAREFALYAAKKAKRPVWLVDLDFFGAGQHRAIAADPGRFGPLGQSSQASPDGSIFVNVQPAARTPDGAVRPDSRYVAAHSALRGRLWVTRFRKEAMKPGQAVRLADASRYWNALAAHAEYVIVDTPAADRSSAALTLAKQVDATVLVVAAESDTQGPAALKAAIEDRGGRLAGLVFNRSRLRPPPFLEKLLS